MFHGPPFPGLDGGGDGFAGDLVVVAEFVEQVPGRGGVVAAVGVHTWLVGQWSDHVRDLAHGGSYSGESCRLAPAPTGAMGMPRPSVATERLVPCLP